MIFKSIFIIFAYLTNFYLSIDSVNFNFNVTFSNEMNEKHHSTTVDSLRNSLNKYLEKGSEEEFWNHIKAIFEILDRNSQNIQLTSGSKEQNTAVSKQVNSELYDLNLPSDIVTTGFKAFMNKRALKSFENNNVIPRRFLDEEEVVGNWTVVNNCTHVNNDFECDITYYTGCEYLLQCYKENSNDLYVNTLNLVTGYAPLYYVSCYLEHGCPTDAEPIYSEALFYDYWINDREQAYNYLGVCTLDEYTYPLYILPENQYLYNISCYIF
jgi:hypothetical protein